VPDGFIGFPGAAGGGLGGGVVVEDEDGNPVRITAITFSEGGDFSTTSIDIIFNSCPDGEIENFTDTLIILSVVNNSNRLVRFRGYTYSVQNFDGLGNTYTSPTINFASEIAVDSDGGTATISALFADAETGGKRFFGNSSLITATGFKNITVTLIGTDAFGAAVRIRARTAASFDNFNRCP